MPKIMRRIIDGKILWICTKNTKVALTKYFHVALQMQNAKDHSKQSPIGMKPSLIAAKEQERRPQ